MWKPCQDVWGDDCSILWGVPHPTERDDRFHKNTETQWAWLFDSFLCCIPSCLVWCQWEKTRLQKNSSQLVHVEGFGFYLHEPKKKWPQIVYVYFYVWWHIHPWLNNYRNNWKNLNYINLLFHPSLLFQGVTNLHIICLRFFLQMLFGEKTTLEDDLQIGESASHIQLQCGATAGRL